MILMSFTPMLIHNSGRRQSTYCHVFVRWEETGESEETDNDDYILRDIFPPLCLLLE